MCASALSRRLRDLEWPDLFGCWLSASLAPRMELCTVSVGRVLAGDAEKGPGSNATSAGERWAQVLLLGPGLDLRFGV